MFTKHLLGTLLAASLAATSLQGKSCSDKKDEYDYIIVGLGTAGSVLARDLSDPVKGKYKNSVLVLEAGQNRSDDPVVYEGENFFFDNGDLLAYDSKYAVTKLCPDLNPLFGYFPNEQFSSGRMWFGSSSHNFMLAGRGSSDRWNDLAIAVGDNQWSYNNLLPLMKSLETYNGVTDQPADRGTNGPLQVSQYGAPFSPADPFITAIDIVTGAPAQPDYNVPSGNIATSPGQIYNYPDFNTRSYAYDFLPNSILSYQGKGQNGRKLSVRSGTFVNRVIFKGTKAVGVEYFLENNRKGQKVYAKKKVILCAGAPFSAAILQRSGIGPSDVLSDPKVNIPVLVDNPLVGSGLKEHYGIIFGMTAPENAIPYPFLTWCDGRDYFAPAGTGDDIRRFQINYFPTAIVLPAGILSAGSINPFQPSIGGFVWYLRPESAGTAYIVDNSPFTLPDIRFNLYSDGDLTDTSSDLSASVAAFKMVKAIADEAGLTMLYPDASHFVSDDILASDAGGCINFTQLAMTNHYTSTCQMGTSIANGVVSSSDLHVFGVKNLMVADSSIYPFPETANTSWQCYVAGRKAAEIIKSQH